MAVSITKSRAGTPTASVDGTWLHSSYNPELEAIRYLEAQKLRVPEYGSAVIIGASLGYLDQALHKIRPGLRIIAVHLDDATYRSRFPEDEKSTGTNPVKRWYPGSEMNLEAFLHSSINEIEISGLQVFQWPAACRIWPDRAREAGETLTRVIRRLTGNISATAAFGRLWLRNTFRNFLSLNSMIKPLPVSEAVVLAASGPSLEPLLPSLRRLRRHYRLWALPSSLAALESAGIEADLVFATDPGHWARIHGRYLSPDTPLAMPLSSSPVPERPGATLLLTQNSPGEAELLSDGRWPTLPLPQMGTVAATAIHAWHRLSSGPLFLAGLDLCWTDLRSHVRPHSFDGWLFSGSSRTNPLLSLTWERARDQAPIRKGGIRTGSALQTYTDYLSSNLPTGPIFRLNPVKNHRSAVPLPSAIETSIEALSGLPVNRTGRQFFPTEQPPLDRNERQKRIQQLLNHWNTLLHDAVDSDYESLNPEIRNLLYVLDAGGVLDITRSEPGNQTACQNHLNRARAELGRLGVPV